VNPTKKARRLLKLADVVEKHEDQFDMSDWIIERDGRGTRTLCGDIPSLLVVKQVGTVKELAKSVKKREPLSCGSTACLGGWTVLTWPNEAHPSESIENAATRILGFEPNELDDLFSMDAPWQTGKAAAAELRRRAAQILAPYDK
jgi:hypothetical protein